MPLPQKEREVAERVLGDYCRKKADPKSEYPAVLRIAFRGNAVTLIERRPPLPEFDDGMDLPLAQFRFDDKTNLWTLYCQWHDRWMEHMDADPDPSLQKLVDEVENDGTGIFGG